MARRRPDDALKAAMWKALLQAAKEHHDHPQDHGIMAKIADDAGVSRATVSDWKRGSSYPEEDTLRRLALLYRVSVAWLAGEQGVTKGHYGSADELLARASAITDDVCDIAQSSGVDVGGIQGAMKILRRAHRLLGEGKDEDATLGFLVREVRSGDLTGHPATGQAADVPPVQDPDLVSDN